MTRCGGGNVGERFSESGVGADPIDWVKGEGVELPAVDLTRRLASRLIFADSGAGKAAGTTVGSVEPICV